MKRVTFNILSWTWGLPMTLIGAVIAVILILTGHKPHKWGYCIYFEIGKDWGGTEFGFFFLVDRTSSASIKCHEFGHGIQNCCWGFLMPFVICIPSAVRCWWRRYLTEVKGVPYNLLPEYDSVWFEGQATRWGTEVYKKCSNCPFNNE